jgi:uncharacterized protein (TIRG00374 family)
LLGRPVRARTCGNGFVGLRWARLLRAAGRLPFLRAVQAIYAGLFTNEILPMRAGYAVQTYLGARFIGRPATTVIPSMIVGAIIDGLWAALALGLVALILPLSSSLVTATKWFIIAVSVLAGAAAAVIIRPPRVIERWSQQPDAGWKGVVKVFITQVAHGVGQVRNLRDLVLAFTYSAAFLMLQALAFWLMMKSYRLDIPFYAGAAVFLIVHLGTAIPNAPSNVGSYQLFTVLGLGMFGVDKTRAAGFSVVVFVLLTLPIWIIGLIAWRRSGLTLGTIRRDARSWIDSLGGGGR